MTDLLRLPELEHSSPFALIYDHDTLIGNWILTERIDNNNPSVFQQLEQRTGKVTQIFLDVITENKIFPQEPHSKPTVNHKWTLTMYKTVRKRKPLFWKPPNQVSFSPPTTPNRKKSIPSSKWRVLKPYFAEDKRPQS